MRHHFRTCLYEALYGLAFVALVSLSCFGQKTVTKDAGAGAKEEMDYDAQGRIVESRTIGADGKLIVKIDYIYSARYELSRRHQHLLLAGWQVGPESGADHIRCEHQSSSAKSLRISTSQANMFPDTSCFMIP